MSRTEHLIGKLKKVEIKTNLEETCAEISNNLLPAGYQTYEEFMRDDSYRKYYFIGNDLYKVEVTELAADENFYSIQKDGSDYSFELRYHNGGMGFDDAIEEALKNMTTVQQTQSIDAFKEDLLEIVKSSNSTLARIETILCNINNRV